MRGFSVLEWFTLIFGIVFWLAVCLTMLPGTLAGDGLATVVFSVFAIGGIIAFSSYFIDRMRHRHRRRAASQPSAASTGDSDETDT